MNARKRLALEAEILDFLSRFEKGLTSGEIVRAFPHSRAGQVLEHLERRDQVEVAAGRFTVTDFGRSRVVGRPVAAAKGASLPW